MKYLFTSERLGFRTWRANDLDALAAINADPEVMRYFPSTLSRAETQAFIQRMQKQFAEKGYCYFAVDLLETDLCIGFIGLSEKSFDAPFNPCVDIGWRLAPSAWGKGLATEGARRCLQFAWESCGLEEVVAVAPEVNLPSIQVMQKIGMQQKMTFKHPLLREYPTLASCVLYKISK